MIKPFQLLALYAHPDDEAFGSAGTFATITDRGGKVSLICATRGEAGEISDASFATPETLAEVREQELRNAMAGLNVNDVQFLGYRDSGMAGTPENDDPRAFIRADSEVLIDTLLGALVELRPVVVLTFGPDGVYGHPDHLKIHDVATRAVERFAERAEDRPALYYNAVPRSRILEMAKRPNGPFKNVSTEELATYGTPDDEITTVIDVSSQFERKMAAIRAHRTQIRADGPWGDRPEADLRELSSSERFRLVPGRDGDPLRDFCG